ncbi:TPM domain-containing protein [Acinetobacter sp.]|uniref:TPM domain-containing protein n=1 Tax=Acinetobacter sp. TaxID=472 RepID=UPI00258F0DE9|nr:TPM domain-containing protein [Acinetobacter sp.]
MNRYLQTMTPQRIIVLLLVSILSICSHALSPELLQQLKQEHIVDTTHTLDRNQIEALKNQNRQLYQQKNIDFKILMIPTIGDTSIEQYAEQVFNEIKIGNAKLDNGLLLVVSKDDRKMRFEVGYGLEGDLTDVQMGRMIRNTLAPNFKNNDYYQGFSQTQKMLFNQNISLKNVDAENPEIVFNLTFYGYLFLSILLCIPMYWVYTKLVVKLGTGGGLAAFVAFFMLEIFIHLLIFSYLNLANLGFFLSALIPIYAPFLIAVCIPKDQNHKVLKCILYSLPLQIFSIFGLGSFYLVDFIPATAFFLLKCLAICLILIFLRYLQFLYRFKHRTENQYLTTYYNQYLREKERQKAREEAFERVQALRKNSNSDNNYSSNHHSSFDGNQDSSSSSSSSTNDERDSGGSSGGGGASSSW